MKKEDCGIRLSEKSLLSVQPTQREAQAKREERPNPSHAQHTA